MCPGFYGLQSLLYMYFSLVPLSLDTADSGTREYWQSRDGQPILQEGIHSLC